MDVVLKFFEHPLFHARVQLHGLDIRTFYYRAVSLVMERTSRGIDPFHKWLPIKNYFMCI